MTNDVRVRSNSLAIYGGSVYHYAAHQYYPDGRVYTFNYDTGAPFPDFHLMVDIVNRDFSNTWRSGIFPVSPCFHMVTEMSRIGAMDDWNVGDGSTVRYDSGGRGRLPLSEPEVINKLVGPYNWNGQGFALSIPSSLRSDLSEQAFNYFSDVFPQSLSFTEFVQGFTSLKDLVPSLKDSVAKSASGGYLSEKFGWENLVSDLNTLSNGFNIVMDRMNFLHRTYGIPTRLGFTRNDVYTPNLESLVYYQYDPVIGCRVRPVKYVANFRATAWIYQVLEYIHDFIGFLRVTAGALGLNNPVKAFWNIVPLSFVVDWFFNVSQHLDHLTRLNPAVGWDVTNVTNSVTYEIEWEVAHWAPYGSQILKTFTVPMHVYDRQVGLSFPWELLNPEELSPSQLSLLLAMLHQLG